MRRFLLLLPFLLAACAPAVAVSDRVTPVTSGGVSSSGDVLPVEAQRIIDRATATAAAVATDQARATAVRLVTQQALQDARDQATLSAAQTQAALDVALHVAEATQAAAGTSAVQTQAAGQTQAWATPTWAALRTQAAAERSGIAASATAISVASDRSQVGANGYRDMWTAAVVITAIALVVLAAIAIYFFYRRQETLLAGAEAAAAEKTDRERLITERAAVDLERAKLLLLKDLMIERGGEPWVISPGGRLLPMLPGGMATASQANQAKVWRWRVAIKKTVYAGIAKTAEKGSPQFGERDLAGREDENCWVMNPDGSPSSTGYRNISRMLRRLGIWTTSGRNTTFAAGWDELRFEREFDHLPLPDLPDSEPPLVRIPPRSSPVSAVAAVTTVPQSPD